MEPDTQPLEYDVAYALRHKSPIKLRRDVEFEIVARAVIAYLRLAGWRFTKSEPIASHSTPPVRRDET